MSASPSAGHPLASVQLVAVVSVAALMLLPLPGVASIDSTPAHSSGPPVESDVALPPAPAHTSSSLFAPTDRAAGMLAPPTVSSTLVLFNDSVVSGNFLAQYGSDPQDVAFDSATDELYVSDNQTNEVSVIGSVASVGNEVIHVVDVGNKPEGVAYDSAHRAVYVANWGDGTVDVINDTTFAVSTISVGGRPISLAYDPHDGSIYVANWETTEVDVINDTTNTVGAVVIHLGGGGAGSLDGIVFDNGTDQIFVASDSRPSPATSMPVNVIDDSNNSSVATVWVGDAPDALAYDANDHYVWAANSGSDNITAINDSSDTVVANYAGFDGPDGIAWSPTDGYVYVSNSNTDNVSTFDPVSGQFEYNTSVGGHPAGIAYTTFLGVPLLVVANSGTSNLSIEDDSSGTVDYTVALAASPFGVAYDPVMNELFVANYREDGTIAVVNDTTNMLAPVAPIAVGKFPVGVMFDPHDDDVYVTNSESNTVSVIADSDNTVIATVTVGTNPWGIAYDPAQDEIFVACNGDGEVYILNGTTNTVAGSVLLGANYAPEGIAFDSASDMLYVAEFAEHSVAVVYPVGMPGSAVYLASLPAGSGPEGVAYDATDNQVFVSNFVSNNVTVYAQPGHDAFYVAANISIGAEPTGIAYDSGVDEVFTDEAGAGALEAIDAATDSAIGGVSIEGDPYGVAVDTGHDSLYATNFLQGSVTVLSVPTSGVTPTVTFTETGLPSGAEWYVNVTGQTPLSSTVVGTSGTTLEIQLSAGSYRYVAATSWSNWTTPSPGEFTVASQDVPEAVPFSAVRYAVTIRESGLATGASWWLNTSLGPSVEEIVTSSGGASGSLELQNGSYSFTATTNWKNFTTPNATGQFDVAGTATTVYLEFTSTGVGPTFAVTFLQHGLPTGVTWYVNISGETGLSATGKSLLIDLPNGGYDYAASSNSAAYRSPPASSFTVANSAQEVNLTYTSVTIPLFEVEFSESGLPSGTNWSVTIPSVATQSARVPGTVDFNLTNGSYEFSMGTVPGFQANVSTGSFAVHGRAVSMSVGFSSLAGTPPGPSPSSGTDWLIGFAEVLVILALVVFIVAYYRRRKAKRAEGGAPPGATGRSNWPVMPPK